MIPILIVERVGKARMHFMNHQIPPDVQERIAARIAKGNFSSEEDVLRQAMDALDRMEEEAVLQWNAKTQQAIAHSESGNFLPLNKEEAMQRVRDRLAQDEIIA